MTMMYHNDRIGHIARNFFHCGAMKSPLAKVMGLQSRQKQVGPKNASTHKKYSTRHRKDIQFSLTTVVILVIPLIIINTLLYIFRVLTQFPVIGRWTDYIK